VAPLELLPVETPVIVPLAAVPPVLAVDPAGPRLPLVAAVDPEPVGVDASPSTPVSDPGDAELHPTAPATTAADSHKDAAAAHDGRMVRSQERIAAPNHLLHTAPTKIRSLGIVVSVLR
jgi:hypothetical protein